MVVKDKRGRRRYIAFTVCAETTTSKGQLLYKLRERSSQMGIDEPRLVQFDGEKGIIRCPHVLKDEMIEMMNSLNGEMEIRTLATSGTLKSLRDRYFQDPP